MWWLIYFLGWFLWNVRGAILKHLNYPLLPTSFNFDDLSPFWTWYLTIFYLSDGYLRNLPLKKADIEKLHKFRSYFSSFPYYLSNFLSFYRIKKKYFKPTFNSYKSNYKLFLIYIGRITFFNNFFKKKNLFLKFIFFKNLITSDETKIFFWISFLKKNIANYYLKNVLFKDFLITILRLLVLHDKAKSFKNYFFVNDSKIIDIFFKKRKFFKKCHNFYFSESQYWLDFFKTQKEHFFFKNLFIYKRIWLNYSSDIFNAASFYEQFVLKINKTITKNNLKNINFLENTVVNINSNFKTFFKNFWPVRYENNTFTKFFDLLRNKDLTIFFLRKSKIFNKGRYSRNRQIYRTGVYMCLWINVIFIYFYFFSFYRLTFNFGFLWLGLGLFIIAMVFSRSAKYRLYNYFNFYNELKLFFNLIGYFLLSAYNTLKKKL